MVSYIYISEKEKNYSMKLSEEIITIKKLTGIINNLKLIYYIKQNLESEKKILKTEKYRNSVFNDKNQ